MARPPSAHHVSPVDGIILGCLLGSLILAATTQLPAGGTGPGGPTLRLLVAALLAGTGLAVFASRLVRRAGRTLGMRLLTPLAFCTVVVWIVIALRLVHGGGPP
jgi:hypothetical protein